MDARTLQSRGVQRLGDGETLSAADLKANALVDQLAKEAAR